MNTKTGMLLAGLATLASVSGAIAAPPDKIQIGDAPQIFPESVTTTSDGSIYAGSLTQGAVFKAAPGEATATQWLGAQTDGPPNVLGVYADEARNRLFVCYSDLAAFAGKAAKAAVLRIVDLKSASVTASLPLPEKSFCNDVATASDGTAYVANTSGGEVLRLAPNGTALESWIKDPQLAGVDGLSLGPDGSLYVNSVSANTLMRIEIGPDGKAGRIVPITPSTPLKGPDGMRFGDDGKLYLAENGNGQVDAITISGDAATVLPLKTGLDAPTAVSKNGDMLYVLEAKIGKLGGKDDPGPFYVYPVAINAAK